MNNHTTAKLGKRIHVILKNGDYFVDKLLGMRSKYYEFENEGRILKDDIRSFSYNKPKGTNAPPK